MNKLKYDGYSIKSKQRNFLYCINELKYNQSCKTPLQTIGEWLYLKDGFIFPSDIKIGKEIVVDVKSVEYGDVKIV